MVKFPYLALILIRQRSKYDSIKGLGVLGDLHYTQHGLENKEFIY